ncbi:hypothetical protein IXB50_04010 [Leptothoe spongobia TAU-MAC 1115]|uniref:O-antigen polymerase n=2 Tax=Leptothoe TaxID=2651725 RepID=A0A947DDK3_9CYAN|nr:hypothetical protein [Leptothoe spongobia TAU-MAC 1115]
MAFSFFAAGKGLIQPSLFLIIAAFLFNYIPSKKKISLKQSLGSNSSLQMIFLFLFIITISTITSFLVPGFNFVSLYKSIGVLVSLIAFLGVYSIISYFNEGPEIAKTFIRDFITVSTVISILVVVEFLFVKLTGRNYFYYLIKGVHDYLPYPSIPWKDISIHDRYKGILTEPGDVGNYIIPAFSALLSKFFFCSQRRTKITTGLILLLYGYAIFLSASVTSIFLLLIIFLLVIFRNRVFYSFKEFLIVFSMVSVSFYFSLSFALDLALKYKNIFHVSIASRIEDLANFFITQQYDNYSNLSVQVILNSYNSTVVALQKNPLFGTGLGNFSISYDLAASANFIETRLNSNDGYSMLLRMLAEVGVLGLVVFIFIFSTRFSQGRKFLKRLKGTFRMLSNTSEKYKQVSKIYSELEQHSLMINAAVIACLLNALLNYPTYWNVVLPMLLGSCYKLSYSKTVAFDIDKKLEQLKI